MENYQGTIKYLRNQLRNAEAKIVVLIKFEVLMGKIYDKYKFDLDEQFKTQYNNILLEYNRVFVSNYTRKQLPMKSQVSQSGSSPQPLSAPKKVSFNDKLLESYITLNPSTNKFEIRFREVNKSPLINSNAITDESTKDMEPIITTHTSANTPSISVKESESSIAILSSSNQLETNESNDEGKVVSTPNPIPNQNFKLVVLKVDSKLETNPSNPAITVRSLGRAQPIDPEMLVGNGVYTKIFPRNPFGRGFSNRKVITSAGKELQSSYVYERYKYFNYETNAYEYRWGYRRKLVPHSKQQIDSKANGNTRQSTGSNVETTTTIVKTVKQCAQNSTEDSTKTVPQINTFTSKWKTQLFTYPKPKRIGFPKLISDKFWDPIIKRYVCDVPGCGKSTCSYSALRGHITDNHQELKFFCDHSDCGKKFASHNKLRTHKLLHSEEGLRFKCDICEYKSYTKSAFTTHMQKKHSNGQTFKCDAYKCGRSFLAEQDLRNHKKEHTSEPTIRCKKNGCTERFFTYPQLNQHNKMVHLDYVYCDWPGCEYKTKSRNWIKHHRLNHTGEKPFVCEWPQCSKRFLNDHYLKYHRKHVHLRGS